MMNRRDGFTLVELLIVVVLGGLILAATFQVLVRNQQVYTAQSASVMGQQTVRGAIELLGSEIREVSTTGDPDLGSDLLLMESDRIRMRVMRKVAIVCGVNNTDPLEVEAAIMGADFAVGDSVLVHANGEVDPDAHFWSRGVLSALPSSGTPANCGGEPSAYLEVNDLIPQITTATQVASGSLLRSFETIDYAPVALDGETFLGRASGVGDPEPVIGPIADENGLRFDYLDADGNAVVDPTAVRAIRITVRTVSGATDSMGNPVSDSLSVFVNPRN